MESKTDELTGANGCIDEANTHLVQAPAKKEEVCFNLHAQLIFCIVILTMELPALRLYETQKPAFS